MPSKIVQRIIAESEIPKLFSLLSTGLPLSDLQSLLLEVYQARVADLREPDVKDRAGRALLAPSKVDARVLNEFDRIGFETASEFDAIELSPVAPLGLTRVLGAIDQNSVLTTIRNAEVLGDATVAMALECSRRRKRDATPVRLVSSHRAVRLQPFDLPGYVPHFRLLSMVSAGRDTGSHAFEIQHLGEHLRFYLRFFGALNARGFSLTAPLVEISDSQVTEALLARHGVGIEQLREQIRAHRLGGSEQFLSEHGIELPGDVIDPSADFGHRVGLVKTKLIDKLQAEFPEAQFRFNFARLEGLSYYSGLCLRISPATSDGARYPIVDGGFTTWTARLLENKKERMLTSGIGSEFVCFQYKTTPTDQPSRTPSSEPRP
jgi:hypothetical protein